MKYFYDHETDAVSLLISDFVNYEATEDLAPGVVMYVDARSRPLAVDLHNASKIIDTNGLVPMYEGPISINEVSQRLSSSPTGQAVLRILNRRSEAMAPSAR
jgi:hypothetical protein